MLDRKPRLRVSSLGHTSMSLLLISPTEMRKTLLITVRMARWKRQVKGILGWLDSR